MNCRLFQVDAFTSHAFSGNPAAVCLLESAQSSEWMQNIASEMNCSASAFLVPLESGYAIRWFTPKQEVPLCGHASLASAHILYQLGRPTDREITFFYKNNKSLVASCQPKNGSHSITLSFPKPKFKARPLVAAATSFSKAMGQSYSTYYSQDLHYYLMELPKQSSVEQLQPDFTELLKAGNYGFIMTSQADGDIDFVSRFFAPAHGVQEDSVCGSAHCMLAAYWSQKLNRRKLSARQISTRGGDIEMEMVDNRVEITACAVTLFEATLTTQAMP